MLYPDGMVSRFSPGWLRRRHDCGLLNRPRISFRVVLAANVYCAPVPAAGSPAYQPLSLSPNQMRPGISPPPKSTAMHTTPPTPIGGPGLLVGMLFQNVFFTFASFA